MQGRCFGDSLLGSISSSERRPPAFWLDRPWGSLGLLGHGAIGEIPGFGRAATAAVANLSGRIAAPQALGNLPGFRCGCTGHQGLHRSSLDALVEVIHGDREQASEAAGAAPAASLGELWRSALIRSRSCVCGGYPSATPERGIAGAAVVRVRSRLVLPAKGLVEAGTGSAVAVAGPLAIELGLGGGKQAEAAERHQAAKDQSAHGLKEWGVGPSGPGGY